MAAESGCSFEDIPLPDGKLPGDVMVSILCILPVKPLMKFKSVSKRWYSCISSPNFIKRHLPRHSSIPNTLVMTLGDYGCLDFGFLPHNHDKTKNTSDADVLLLESRLLFPSYDNNTLIIIDSCYGLVCLFSRPCGLILCNPASRTHRSIELPGPDYNLFYSSLGLCYVEATNDFKIVGWTSIHNPGNRQYLFVYSLSSDSWEKSDYDARNVSVDYQLPTFMSGCMHWSAKRSCIDVIMAFDVLGGAMSFFGVPVYGGGLDFKSSTQTLVIRGCLSVGILADYNFIQHEFGIWVMEEYGVECSWVKRFHFCGHTQINKPLIPLYDGKIVFTSAMGDSNTLTFVDPFSKERYCLHFRDFYVYQLANYVVSLASVGTMPENALFLN